MNSTPPALFHLRLKSSLKQVHRVVRFLRKVNKVTHLDEEHFYRLLLSTSEAVNNAILHGNRSDEKKQVEVVCEIKSRVLIVRVSDEGNGFDTEKTPNPLRKNNKLRAGGRGIFLMKALMDDVTWKATKTGFTLQMKLRLK